MDALELLEDGAAVVEGDVFEVEHDLVDGDVVAAADFDFEFERLDEDVDEVVVFGEELKFGVVDSVEDVFEVGDLGQVGGEVAENALIEPGSASGQQSVPLQLVVLTFLVQQYHIRDQNLIPPTHLFINLFDIFQQRPLINFFKLKKLPKQLKIFHLQQVMKRLLLLLPKVILLPKVCVNPSVQKYLLMNVARHFLIVPLHETYYLV